MQHNSWSKGVSLPSVIFVFGNMVYIVWSSSLLTASKVSFGWCLSKQSCSSFILMAERELSVFTLRDWHGSVSAFLAGAECPPPLAQASMVQWAPQCAGSGLMCTAPMQKCLPVLPLLNHIPRFCVLMSLILPLILPYVSCGSGMMEMKESRHPGLKEVMLFAVMAMGNLSKSTGCGRSTCSRVTREGKTSGCLESLQLGSFHGLLLWRWWRPGREWEMCCPCFLTT